MRAPTLAEVATFQPGKCFLCGTIDGPFADTHVDAAEGNVYVCVQKCVAALASLTGLGEVVPLEQKIADLEAELSQAKSRIEAQQPYVDVITAAARTKPKAKAAA